MQHRFLVVLAAALALPIAPLANAVNPLDDDAGSGGDAGDTVAEATPVALSTIVGRLTYPIDTYDHYLLDIPAGRAVIVSPDGPVSFDVVGEDGAYVEARTCHVSWERATLFEGPRRLVLIAWSFTPEVAVPYTLKVEDVPWFEDDAGTGDDVSWPPALVGAGEHAGQLNRFDCWDSYQIALSAGERLHAAISGPGLGITLGPPTLARGVRETTYLAFAPRTLNITVGFNGTPYAADYTLSLTVSQWATESEVDTAPLALPVGNVSATGLLATADGLYMTSGKTLRRLQGDVVESIGVLPFSMGSFALDADGSVYDGRIRARNGSAEFVSAIGGSPFFGPDGDLYVAGGLPQLPGLFRVGDARPLLPGFGRAAMGADGAIYALRDEAVVRIDPGTGDLDRIATVGQSVRHLTGAADGSLYLADVASRFVLRLDPPSGALVVVGRWVDQYILDLEVFDGMLYLAGPRLLAIPIGVDGTVAVQPAYANIRPDIAVVRAFERHVPASPGHDVREVVVEFRNDGTAAALAPVTWLETCGVAGCRSFPSTPSGPPLDPMIGVGETAVTVVRYEAAWTTQISGIGDRNVTAMLTTPGDANPGNDDATYQTCWRVCGVGVGT